MKICPKCQQQFPNGFQYCPNDTEHLIASEEYARRTKPTTSAPKIEPIERPPSIPIPPRSPEPYRARQTEPYRPELPRSEPPVRPSQNALSPDPPSFSRPPVRLPAPPQVHTRPPVMAGPRRLQVHPSPRVPGLKRSRPFNQLRRPRTEQSHNQIKADRLKAVPQLNQLRSDKPLKLRVSVLR